MATTGRCLVTLQHPAYGTCFAHWRAQAGCHWSDYVEHAFVQQLGNGDLPEASFLHYLQQDYVFLMHFSRAWALAAAKSETLSEMGVAASTLQALVHHEMPLHVRLCEAKGIAPSQLESTPEATANMAYTRFVLEAGYSGDLLDLLAALAPCVWGYGEIGLRLQGSHSRYHEWIDTYAGEPYQHVCQAVGQLIDSAAQRRLGDTYGHSPRMATLSLRFQNACRLEASFWQMALDRTL